MTVDADIERMSGDELAEYAMCRNIIFHNLRDGIITPMMCRQMIKQLEAVFGVVNRSKGRY